MAHASDRIRESTAPEINRRLDDQTAARLEHYATASAHELTARIDELDRELDIERVLETNASTLAFIGVAGAIASSRRWLILPAVVLPFLFMHAVQGWCPPLPLLRRLGVRSRKEIERERYALKMLRGDFGGRSGEARSAAAAMRAVSA
jgi:hypothetical protein